VFLSLGPDSPLLAEAKLLTQVNRRLRFGGLLVLSLAGVAPLDHPLASRAGGMAALRGAGYRVDLAGAAAAPGLAGGTAPEPDGVVWRAIKVSDFEAPGMTQAA
jgi:hypothetical protein